MAWWPDRGGIFSVRSAYWVQTCGTVQDWEARLGGDGTNIWKLIWRVKVPYKIRNFVWRLCSNALPSKQNLRSRHIIREDLCSRCHNAIETDWHHLFLCPDAQEAWVGSPLVLWLQGKTASPIVNTLTDLFHVQGYAGIKEFSVRAWISWTIRNRRLFDPDQLNIPLLRGNLLKMVDDYEEVQPKRTPTPPVRQPALVRWKKPRAGNYKLNTDACVINDSLEMGVVGRNDAGEIVLLANKKIDGCADILLGEALACLWGLELGIQYGFFGVEFETDCQCWGKHYTGNVVYSILAAANHYLEISFNCNAVAHLAARLCLSSHSSSLVTCNFPQSILDFVEIDLI